MCAGHPHGAVLPAAGGLQVLHGSDLVDPKAVGVQGRAAFVGQLCAGQDEVAGDVRAVQLHGAVLPAAGGPQLV